VSRPARNRGSDRYGGPASELSLADYRPAIERVAATRAQLVEARQGELWTLFPGPEAGSEAPTTALGGGSPKPSRALGVADPVAAAGALDALRADAEALRQGATPEQRQTLTCTDTAAANATWAGTPEHADRDRSEKQAMIERLRGDAHGWGG